MFLRGDISIFSPGRFSEIVAILTAPAVVPTRSYMTVTFFAKKFAKFYFTAKSLQPCRFEHRTHLSCKFEHENPKKVCPGSNGLIVLEDVVSDFSRNTKLNSLIQS
jgi:hypothetical protein